MNKLPLLLTLVAGVALWAIPSAAQVTDFWPRYVADSAAPGEGNTALPNGYELCPPHNDYCTHYSQAHHHIAPAVGAAPYATNVLDVHNCEEVVVRVMTQDTDGTVAELYVQPVLSDAGAGNACAAPVVTSGTFILMDVNGDGVINEADEVPLDGDDGSDNDGDFNARQTSAMYGIVANKIQLCVSQLGGGFGENSYVEVSCR